MRLVSLLVLAFICASSVLAQEGRIEDDQVITVTLPSQDTGVEQRVSDAEEHINCVHNWPEPVKTKTIIREIKIVQRYLIKRNIIKKQSISDEEIQTRLRTLGYPAGGPATWGRAEVLYCLNAGLMVGMKPGTTPSSKEWKQPATREQLATVSAREARLREQADLDGARARQDGDDAERYQRQKADLDEAWARQIGGQAESTARKSGDSNLESLLSAFAILAGLSILLCAVAHGRN